jgi:hypothetical protein
VPRERIIPEHKIEGRIELRRRHLPRAERAARETRREHRLPYSTNRPGFEHRRDALDDGIDRNLAAGGDLAERVGLKTGKAIL